MKNKNIFFICQRVVKTVKSQGKTREKSGNFEVDDKWQPCGWLILSFMYLSTEFQLYQEDGGVVLKSCMQWNPVYSWKKFCYH